MAATGFFNLPLANTLLARQRVIYRAPSTPPTGGGSIPISRLPVAPAPTPPPIIKMGLPPKPTPVAPIVPQGGEPTAPGPTVPASTPGTTTGAGSDTGGGSGTDSRLLDLLAGAFKPQDISQPYGPIASGPTEIASSGGGVNPALLILAFVAIVGVMWWMNRQKRKAA